MAILAILLLGVGAFGMIAGVASGGVAIYPFVGNGTRAGDSVLYKYNLLDTQDSDSSFRLTWGKINVAGNTVYDGMGVL